MGRAILCRARYSAGFFASRSAGLGPVSRAIPLAKQRVGVNDGYLPRVVISRFLLAGCLPLPGSVQPAMQHHGTVTEALAEYALSIPAEFTAVTAYVYAVPAATVVSV
jgi:hypothetical protein